MAELNTVARPYTKAAFEFAQEKSGLDQWSKMLSTVAAVANDSVMANVLGNPALTSEQKASAIVSVCEDYLDQPGKNFIQLLAVNQRLGLLQEINVQFEQLKANLQKSVDIDVTTAYELDEQQQQKLTQALSAKLGRDVTLTSTVDKSILGGVVLRSQDLVIDGSVRARLAKLAEALNS
ncbi:F0F1 ATP synthase subunit delta [Neptunomonas antarctica]|jgi:F-type H+-transporting ATPase subunit delta|uniref:ATP synthase subunit delta n=1 Tax=Neptunomonas antarctica TaxID=619304 RepID=A0A1N7ISF2_9GAMM|nr:F0F1 ATP synthase subunit delta [Neptunomonas antarctica]SIS40039.1 ATP synthase F1 subcomplex delta subunit [Neptunomonas antarctica]